MRTRPFVVAAFVVVCLLSVSAAFSAPVAAESIDVEHTLAQNDADGEVDVRTDLDVPSGTASLEITLPKGTDVYETEGFSQVGERTYEWTKTTNQPYLRYSMDGNDTIDRGNGRKHLYAVTDEWAVVRTPSTTLQWTGVEADVAISANTDGEGVAGRHITYLGPYEETTREASGQRFRLVEADASDLHEDRTDILDSLEYASRRLTFGEKDEEVIVIVVPTDSIEWATSGVQRGDSDMWVRDAERLDSPTNTWVHEYVHTRQDYDRTEKTRWSIEGMADYYAALLTYERGNIDYERFRNRMERGQIDDVRLVEPSTWESNLGNYHKGALVFAHLDRRLRTERDATIDDVIADVNTDEEELSHEELLAAVEDAGGGDIRADAETYTETTDSPDLWSRSEHIEAFGGPDIRYSMDAFAVSGPYRNETVDRPRLVAGETLTATVRVENVGTQEADFEADFRIDSEEIDRKSGTLAAGEETTLTFEYTFEEAGEFDLQAGTASETAVVEPPADIEVTGLEAEPNEAPRGQKVTLRATVEATAERPAAGEVVIAVDGERVATEAVRMAESTRTVETTTTFDAAGDHEVTAGERSVTVTITEETVTPDPTATAGRANGDGGRTPAVSDGAGFGAVGAVVALLGAALFARRR